jgi:hypothetical protein
MIVTVLCLLSSVAAQAKDNHCSAATAAGTWAFTTNGSIVGVGPVSAVGTFTSDASAKMTGSQTRSLNGNIAYETFTGTLTVNSDCTANATLEVFQSGVLVRTSIVTAVYDENSLDLRGMFTSVILPDGTSLAPILTIEGKRVFLQN